MIEICTAVLGFTVTLQGCVEPERCWMSKDGTKKLCVEARGIACPRPITEYRCRRANGEVYIWNGE